MRGDTAAKVLGGWSVDSNGCWCWRGAKADGYGRVSSKGRLQQAHRVVYELLVGEIPDGLVLHHRCRNRACVNPDHLEPTTQRQNIRYSTVAKLDLETVAHMRRLHRVGESYAAIGRQFGVSDRCVSLALHRKTWADAA